MVTGGVVPRGDRHAFARRAAEIERAHASDPDEAIKTEHRGLVTAAIFNFLGIWNEYLFALTFTVIDPPSRTVPVAIALFTGEIARQEPFGEIMAAAVIVTVPLVALVLIFQQRIGPYRRGRQGVGATSKLRPTTIVAGESAPATIS